MTTTGLHARPGRRQTSWDNQVADDLVRLAWTPPVFDDIDWDELRALYDDPDTTVAGHPDRDVVIDPDTVITCGTTVICACGTRHEADDCQAAEHAYRQHAIGHAKWNRKPWRRHRP